MSRERFDRGQLNNWGKYKSFAELLADGNVEGEDYVVNAIRRDSPVVIMAPHGGCIEPGSERLAKDIAGDTHSFYEFCGLKEEGNHDLHITSHRFDEPRALELAGASEFVLTVHGYPSEEEFILVGGKRTDLALNIMRTLSRGGFPVVEDMSDVDERMQGTLKNNICNRGTSGEGVQLEISSGLMQRLLNDDPDGLRRFVGIVRTSLELYLSQR